MNWRLRGCHCPCTERRRCGKHQDWQCRSLRHLTIRFGGSPCRPGFPQTFKHVSAYFNLHSSDSTVYIFCLTLALGFIYHFYVHFRKRNNFWNVSFIWRTREAKRFLRCECTLYLVIYSYCIMQETVSHRVDRLLSFFSSRRNWDSPTLLAAGEYAPHPLVRGGGHTRLRERGLGSPNSDEGTYTVVLYI